MKKVWVIGILAVLATGIALGSAPTLAPEPATDEEAAWIRDQIENWKEDPEMKIAASDIDRSIYRVTLWVYERTPENERLHHEMIDGWEIIVAESPEPSLCDTFYDIFTNTTILLWILAGCVFLSLVVVFVKYRGRRRG